MRITVFATLVILISCNGKKDSTTISKRDTFKTTVANMVEERPAQKDTLTVSKAHSNERFKEVIAQRIGIDSFLIHGRAQIFEARFNWVLEDGHEELKRGSQMTDAGAPEWGKFEFIVRSKKRRINSTITLILFESSAMDGSRQHELPIVLD